MSSAKSSGTKAAAAKPAPKQKPVAFALAPVDNVLLANLCGPLDENIRQIETGFDVVIRRRNERFSILGEKAQLTADALRHFYGMARQPLSVDEIQLGLVQFTNGPVRRITPGSITDGPQLITRKTDLHGRTPRQVAYLKAIQEHDITFGIGPAGTGKTYLAVASAVDAFERDLVERIILTRPAVEAGERLGFLPGDLTQKIDPYLRPLYDALYDLMGADRVSKLYEKRAIEIAPLAFMRGRTLNHAFIILDEAQNTTPEQMKMFLTRIGIGAKAVVTGDITQIDLPKGHKSGLREARDILQNVRGLAFTEFQKEDVVRHPLVARIVAAYESKQTS
ncbi:PhoH family protein [Quatrionicoccus australiensis]|nr:PhoH family protein [Quatrionicoccus australiensis]